MHQFFKLFTSLLFAISLSVSIQASEKDPLLGGIELNEPTLGPALGVLSDNKTRVWFRGPVFEGNPSVKTDMEAIEETFTGVLYIKKNEEEQWGQPQLIEMKVPTLGKGKSAKNRLDFVGFKDLDLPEGKYDYKCGVVSRNKGVELQGGDIQELDWSTITTHTFTIDDPKKVKDTAFVFGSCRHFVTDLMWWNPFLQRSDGIFGEVLKHNDLATVAFLGDNGYADPLNWLWRASEYHHFMRVNEGFMSTSNMKKLLATHRTVCIGDDHEVRDNEDIQGNKNQPHVKKGLEAYNTYQYMRTAGYDPEAKMPTGSYEFPINGVPGFVMDTRYNRDVGSKKILSSEDMEKLKDWLRRHKDDPFKVLFSGVPMFPGFAENQSYDSDIWRGASPEQLKEILDFIDENKIEGVVICSGDVHRSMGAQIETPINKIKVTNLISSPFHWWLPKDRSIYDIHPKENGNGIRKKEIIPGYEYTQFSEIFDVDTFGKVVFREDRKLQFFLYGKDGTLLNEGGLFAKGIEV